MVAYIVSTIPEAFQSDPITKLKRQLLRGEH